MLHEYEGEIKNLILWCDEDGLLLQNGTEIEFSDLPENLQRAWKIWGAYLFGTLCYLAEFNGNYGIALEMRFSESDARHLKISYKDLVEMAREKAVECAEMYPEQDVLFGKDAIPWGDGTADTVVIIFLPWNLKIDEVDETARAFHDLCYIP